MKHDGEDNTSKNDKCVIFFKNKKYIKNLSLHQPHTQLDIRALTPTLHGAARRCPAPHAPAYTRDALLL